MQKAPALPHSGRCTATARRARCFLPTRSSSSRNHATRYGGSAYVYNGLDPAEFDFRRDKDAYDLFLGRLHSVKGYQWAIEGTKRLGRKLVVAGGWRPSLSRGLRYLGSVDGAEKRRTAWRRRACSGCRRSGRSPSA